MCVIMWLHHLTCDADPSSGLLQDLFVLRCSRQCPDLSSCSALTLFCFKILILLLWLLWISAIIESTAVLVHWRRVVLHEDDARKEEKDVHFAAGNGRSQMKIDRLWACATGCQRGLRTPGFCFAEPSSLKEILMNHPTLVTPKMQFIWII